METQLIKFTALESELVALLQAYEKEVSELALKGNTKWTELLKDRLGKRGHEKGYDVCASGYPDRFEKEWLFDLVWYQQDEQQLLLDVPLVMESEWDAGLKYIKYDFEKLLLANAATRLMVCQAKPGVAQSVRNYFQRAIESYRRNQPGDRYLVALLNTDSEEFDFEVMVKSGTI
jgi:hypothetical protein